jgi:hypothetical protein
MLPTDKALDLPDDAPWAPGSIRTPISDLGEAAARLGSPAVYDRRGQVIWMDAFEYGLSDWTVNHGGGTSEAYITNKNSYRHGYSLNLFVDAAAGHYIFVNRKFILSEVSRAGIEVCFAWLSPGNQFYVSYTRNISGVGYTPSITIDNVAKTLSIYTASGSVIIDNLADNMASSQPSPHIIKFVVDWNTNKWVRIMLDENEYNISKYAIASGAGDPDRYDMIKIASFSDGVHTENTYISHCVVTSNEP